MKIILKLEKINKKDLVKWLWDNCNCGLGSWEENIKAEIVAHIVMKHRIQFKKSLSKKAII